MQSSVAGSPSPQPVTLSNQPFRTLLEPRLLLRWIYIGRLSVASAIFIAALFRWLAAEPEKTLVASLAFAGSIVFTVVSAAYSGIYRRPLGATFLYVQAIFDLALVTAVVHLTTAIPAVSPFSALYILVIAASSLLLPGGGSLLIAALGNVLYVADIFSLSSSNGELPPPELWFQLAVFAVVAFLSAFLSAKLRWSGEASDLLRVEHEQVRLRAEEILRTIRSGVVTIDAHGRLVYANPMAEQLLGIRLSEQIGAPVLEQVGARAPELAEVLSRAVHDRVRTERFEGTVDAEGREFPIGVTTTYHEDETTGARTAIAIFQDISDHKRLESMRLRAERLEGIAELSASLAHEIKNPLASIRSSVEQIARMPKTTPDERTLADLVMHESDRLSRLLSDFLDFARVRVAHARPVDFSEVVRGAARLAAEHPDRREGVRVDCRIPTADLSSLIVQGDEDLLHRAVFNLTLNAVQASPPGAEVTVELIADARRSPVGAAGVAADDAIVLRVSDRGSGIPLEIRDRLFDPFFTTKPYGSGLGLSVVHRAIEAHRGAVLVDSGDRGTTFTVVLPRTRSGSPSAPVPVSP